MIYFIRSRPVLVPFFLFGALLFGCSGKSASSPKQVSQASCTKAPMALATGEVLVSILGTNDIHGSIQPKKTKNGQPLGGMAFWAGAVKSVRDGMAKRYGDRGGVLVLDGGDQFQGSLLSNYSEGALFFSLMNEVGYDAIVPGNHDYDFGPEGWLVDQVPAGALGDPRGVIKKLSASAQFPMLSSNTYKKASLKTVDGKDAEVSSVGCVSKEILDWTKAERPEFLQSYRIKTVAGLRVAIIGLDNPMTPTTTTAANISDLCFRTSIDEYKEVRTELEGKADLFIAVIHDGDINEDKNLTTLLETIQAWRPDGVDAIIGGHTHQINRIARNGVYAIQSGSYGQAFGRIDLVVDGITKKVLREKTRVAAGASLFSSACDPKINSFCEESASAQLTYECEEVVESPVAAGKISEAEVTISPLVSKVLGTVDAPIVKDRDNESPLLNFLTDTYRKASGADIAMINTGGVRVNIDAGTLTYEKLFQVSPFNNRAVILAPMKVATLQKIMDLSARTCGAHGAVLASGIRVVYRRSNCKNAVDGMDPTGGVVTISLDDGTPLYDARDPANIKIFERDLRVATLDFLATGASGYVYFKDAPVVADIGIFREVLVDELAKNPGKITGKIDGRFVNELAPTTK